MKKIQHNALFHALPACIEYSCLPFSLQYESQPSQLQAKVTHTHSSRCNQEKQNQINSVSHIDNATLLAEALLIQNRSLGGRTISLQRNTQWQAATPENEDQEGTSFT